MKCRYINCINDKTRKKKQLIILSKYESNLELSRHTKVFAGIRPESTEIRIETNMMGG